MVLGKSECVFPAYKKVSPSAVLLSGISGTQSPPLQTQASAAPGPTSIFKLFYYN